MYNLQRRRHMSAIPNQTSEPQAFQLSWNGPKVALSPEDKDRFIKEAQRAFLVGRNGLAFERFWQQFADDFLPAVHRWCQEHHDRVASCYVPFPRDHAKVFVVTRSQSYDFTL